MTNKTTETNGNGTKIRKVLMSEVSILISVVAVVYSFILFIVVPNYQMKSDIALIQKDITEIKNNHLIHINDSLEKHEEKNDEQDKILNSIENNITKILTILEK